MIRKEQIIENETVSKTVDIWKTSDNHKFYNEKEAEDHEAELDYIKLITRDINDEDLLVINNICPEYIEKIEMFWFIAFTRRCFKNAPEFIQGMN